MYWPGAHALCTKSVILTELMIWSGLNLFNIRGWMVQSFVKLLRGQLGHFSLVQIETTNQISAVINN